MSDEDFSGAGAGVDTSNLAPGKHRGPRFSWNPAYEATFFRSLCESVQLGLREGSTFKPEAWDRAMAALIQQHSAYANKSHLINKSDNARKKFRLWRGLREDPDFQYNRVTRTVTASDETWKRHIEQEPLSRSLKGRPFEHEEYYEILFPDVIGSRGVPKRLTKPRRKGDNGINGSEEQDAPGTGIMDLLGDTSYSNPSQGHMPPPLQPTPTPAPASIAVPPLPSSHQQQQHQSQQQQQQHSRPPSNIMPPRNSVASTSALTPPEDQTTHTRKRFHQPDSSSNGNPPTQAEKRRRTAANAAPPPSSTPNYLDLTQQQSLQQPQQLQHQTQPQPPQTTPSANTTLPSTSGPVNGVTSSTSSVITTDSAAAQALLAEALRLGAGKLRPTWQEQAMDIFFRDFGAEDFDLQVKIAEKALTDENKAMAFVKMPVALRRHWVKRLREVHNRIV